MVLLLLKSPFYFKYSPLNRYFCVVGELTRNRNYFHDPYIMILEFYSVCTIGPSMSKPGLELKANQTSKELYIICQLSFCQRQPFSAVSYHFSNLLLHLTLYLLHLYEIIFVVGPRKKMFTVHTRSKCQQGFLFLAIIQQRKLKIRETERDGV